MTLESLIESKPCTAQDFRIQPTPIVYNHTDGRTRGKSASGVREDVRHTVDVRGDRLPPDAAGRAPELFGATLLEPEELVGVAVLLVVVDQPRVRGVT